VVYNTGYRTVFIPKFQGMPARKITPEIESEIKQLGKEGKSVAEISAALKLKYTTVHGYMNDNGMDRRIEKTNTRKKIRTRNAEFFNEHERGNWLI
jgi:DNA-binding NarL/FixJ family response regulator